FTSAAFPNRFSKGAALRRRPRPSWTSHAFPRPAPRPLLRLLFRRDCPRPALLWGRRRGGLLAERLGADLERVCQGELKRGTEGWGLGQMHGAVPLQVLPQLLFQAGDDRGLFRIVLQPHRHVGDHLPAQLFVLRLARGREKKGSRLDVLVLDPLRSTEGGRRL